MEGGGGREGEGNEKKNVLCACTNSACNPCILQTCTTNN